MMMTMMMSIQKKIKIQDKEERTMLKHWFKIFVFMLAAPFFIVAKDDFDSVSREFLASFLKHYEFSPEGRYVHEYHPFVLKKTRESFLGLEDALRQQEFSLESRIIILGYEEQGVPTYYTDFTQPKIDDEAMVKGKAGWSLKLHNRFGCMTGFLLKDVNRIAQIHGFQDRQIFEHVSAEQPLIFNDRASIFQEHAFGQALPLMIRTKNTMNDLVKKGAAKEVLRGLIPFWEILYTGKLKVGNSEIAGTQDILFSIEYGRYVLSSKTALRRCFIGPDITYPIEIFAKQQKGVTRNSQAFVKSFVPNLKPVNDESTVYIFCSFVDGVGKSTMLGNIKNWMKHGPNVNLYDHVDNSSSQLAEIFQFKDKVFIADLPAQLSHFTYKPDGMVYVDVRTELSVDDYAALDRHVLANKSVLMEAYSTELARVRTVLRNDPSQMHALAIAQDPAQHFLRNLVLLKKDRENAWAPCSFEGRDYLFNMASDGEYRVLLPLGKAKSEGLKNIQADQMLFVDGVRLPLPYDYFINNLVSRLKDVGVKRVVFVDFLSMYPRSSRENIRVNYLLQQLALLDVAFDVQQSTYRNFTNGGELLYCLLQQNISDRMTRNLELEALVRWQLFSLIKDRKEGDLSGYTEEMLTEKLRTEIAETRKQNSVYVPFKKNLQVKLGYEKNQLNEKYGNSKSFVNVQLFSMQDASNFYRALQFFMTNNLECPLFERVWEEVGALPQASELSRVEQGFCDHLELVTSERKRVRVLYKIHETCRSEALLAPFLRMMRLGWLTSIFCLFGGASGMEKAFSIEDPMFPHLPIHLVPGEDGYWFLVQEIFESVDLSDELPPYVNVLGRLCGISMQTNKIDMCLVDDMPCISTCPNVPTNVGIFDYDCTLSRQKTSYSESAMTKLVRKLQKDASLDIVTPLIKAYDGLLEFPSWAAEQRAVMAKMQRRIPSSPEQPCGLYALLEPKEDAAKPRTAYSMSMPIPRSIKTVLVGTPWQEETIRQALRMWFTLDMIIKDPDSELVVRSGNRDDIAAAVTLLEAFIMPKYFGLSFEHNLFPDYGSIEYFPSNEYWPHFESED
jgi:hypothetical protein